MMQPLARLRRKLRSWRCREDGSAALEFALVAIPFFWLFMGIVEIGMMMIFNNDIEDGVDRAARMIRTGQAAKHNFNAGRFRQEVCKQVVLKTNCLAGLIVDVRRFNDFASIPNLPTPAPGGSGKPGMGNTYQKSAPLQVVVVRVFYPWKFFTPMIGRLMGVGSGNYFILDAATTFRNEPYGS